MAIGGFFFIRWYRRRRQFGRPKSRGSSQALNREAGKSVVERMTWMTDSGYPWWHWRRWKREESPHYFALTERGEENDEYRS